MMKILRCCEMLSAVLAAGCARGEHAEAARRSPLETSIARALTARFGEPATATCELFAPVPVCRGELADGTPLPIRVATDGSAWTWQLDDAAGRFVDTKPLAAYIDGLLGDLGVPQSAQCGPRLRRVAIGERFACALSGGGSAFVVLGDDGTPEVELALDPAEAAVRGEPVTPERARELEQESRALASGADLDSP